MYSLDMPNASDPNLQASTRETCLVARRELPALEPAYYLDNFLVVLSTILSRYADLLIPDELRFITEFAKLPRKSQSLLARMVMRRGELFRASQLQYAEIGDTRSAAQSLIEAGWITDRPMLAVAQLQGILTKPELIRCFRLPRRYTAWRKPDLIAMLTPQFKRPRYFADWWPGHADAVYALLVAPTCERFRLMFFGNHRQGWSDFVTADLRIFKYEQVERTLHSRPFATRAHIEACERLQECGELFAQGMPLADLMQIIPQAMEGGGWIEDRRQQLIFNIAREFEREGDVDKALALYLRCSHRGARTRAIRLTARTRDWAIARALCLDAQRQPESEAELKFLRRILPRASRQLGIPTVPVGTATIPSFELALVDLRAGGAVEYGVRDYLARDVTDCGTVRYVENSLINALFGLLCWPAIFAPIAGAFFHGFHRGPADLACVHFYRRRRGQFEHCLSQLQSGRYRQSIWETFGRKWGTQTPFVRWQALDRPLLQWALDCFPAAHLQLWFEWIARDVEANRSGFPDLVQFWPDESRYRMIEVKGPGDRLQDNQRRFLDYCVSHDMPVSVCYVRRAAGEVAPISMDLYCQ
jgi:hypothetical protein